MASRTGKNISGHYIVLISTMSFHICALSSKNLKGRTESYLILFQNSTTTRHDVLVSGYVESIPTAVSSN